MWSTFLLVPFSTQVYVNRLGQIGGWGINFGKLSNCNVYVHIYFVTCVVDETNTLFLN